MKLSSAARYPLLVSVTIGSVSDALDCVVFNFTPDSCGFALLLLEWDVFLDPYLVRRVEIVLSEKEAFLQRQKDARKKSQESTQEENNVEGAEDESHPTPMNNAADERLVLSYYDKEIKRRTTILVERMLIAHGNFSQLAFEQSGYFKK
jgi:hypothetical protein